MKKILSLLSIAVLTFVLAACSGNAKEDKNKLVVGATNVPHAEILEQAKPLLEKEGIELEIETFQEYVLPNKALAQKELGANFYQHKPFFEKQIKEHGYEFEDAGGVHIEPIGIYSKKYKKLEDVKDGATVILSNSVADHGRVLLLLQEKGLITLKKGKTIDATFEDIAKNPKNLTFKYDVNPELLPKVYENNEGDLVIINSNFALDAGLNPMKDAIEIEDENSPYVNIVAVRKGDTDDERIQKLMEVLHSKEIQDWIIEKYEGAVVPVNK